MPGAWSVEAPPEVIEEDKREEGYRKQYEERKRIRRKGRLNLTRSYHACDDGCCHAAAPSPPEASKGVPNPKSWFQKYAELALVEVGTGGPEVNEVPKVNYDADFEVISVTVDSGAYNTVGPPKTGTYFNLAPTEAS